MASFGHVAVGLLTGRLHGGGGKGAGGATPAEGAPGRRPISWATLLVFAGLALLPDADVFLVAFGACDNGACGHRGASHSFPLAIAVGLLGACMAWRLGWPVLRTFLATACAVASHALLDLLCAGGRGLPLLWPFSDERFMSPIRIFRDAPRGLALLSRPGLVSLAIEFAVFLPVVIIALWPRIVAWLSARGIAGRIPKLPNLTFIEGGVSEGGVSAPPGPAPVATDGGDPSLRSTG
jgi:inner membrane protein